MRKGAPRQILDLCSRCDADGRTHRTTDAGRDHGGERRRWPATACACSPSPRGPVDVPTESALGELTFVGFLGLMDPPAPACARRSRDCAQAGMRTVMLTGDQRLTAEAVGRELGLLAEDAAVARAAASSTRMPPADLAARVGDGRHVQPHQP